ncbi:MAG: RHS repeat-associated core domain-containing protein [Anaerovoracaceae bacterium]
MKSETSNLPEVIAERINTYDPANRLCSLTDTKAGKTILAQENEYNGAGQRIKKTESLTIKTAGKADANKVTERSYAYQAGQVLYTEDRTATNQTSLIGTAKISAFNMLGISDNIIGTERRTTNPKVPRVYYFYNKDLRASTTSVVAESGAAVKAYKYDEFGNTESFGNLDNEIAYTGGIYDKNTQLYYLNARYYNPEDGRFITQDSYRGTNEDIGTWHLYAYCGNNPVNYVDPSGHKHISTKKTRSEKRYKWISFTCKKKNMNKYAKSIKTKSIQSIIKNELATDATLYTVGVWFEGIGGRTLTVASGRVLPVVGIFLSMYSFASFARALRPNLVSLKIKEYKNQMDSWGYGKNKLVKVSIQYKHSVRTKYWNMTGKVAFQI